MKNKLINLILLILTSKIIIAQVNTCQLNGSNYNFLNSINPCNTCSILKDYIPDETHDSIVYVKLNFIFALPLPYGTPNPFSNITISDPLNVIWALNNVFDSLFAPNLVNSPTANYIKKSKIRFVLNRFDTI